MKTKIPHIFLTGHPSVGKTTIIKRLQASLVENTLTNVSTNGFYTEECRSKRGDRIGFDILFWTPSDNDYNDDTKYESKPKRKSLSRLVTDRTLKKSDPHVGKYLVHIENVENYAVSSIDSSKFSNEVNNQLVLIDEVGKMEMLCPTFLPAVHKLLNESSSSSSSSSNPQDKKRIIIGTIPTPRYGRVIPAVEEIREREDTLVLHVTKSNRDEIREILQGILKEVFSNHTKEICFHKDLGQFLYTRPIGASSMNGIKSENDKMKSISKKMMNPVDTTTPDHDQNESISRPCEPLYMDTVKPKVLLLGETASPLPSNKAYSYHERSMWTVLSHIIQMDYKPIKHIHTAGKVELEKYTNLQRLILSKGICIWDVFLDVHEDKSRKGKTKRQRKQYTNHRKPNNIAAFLEKNPSIQMIGFIGQKACNGYKKYQIISSKIELVTLPSSSPANSGMRLHEKASAWKEALSKYIPDL